MGVNNALIAIAVTVSLAGCFGSGSDGELPDAKVTVDPAGTHFAYVVDGITLPGSQSEAIEFGFDLDRDSQERPDNALGQILSIILQFSNYNELVQGEIDERLANGELIHLFDVQAVSLRDAGGVGLLPFLGSDPDGDPSDNWPGPELYETTTEGAVAAGAIVDGTLHATRGRLPLTFALPNVAQPMVLELHAAEVRGTITDSGISGTIGGAIREADIDRVLVPMLHVALQAMVDDTCPDGVCVVGSIGEDVLHYFDADRDGAVTEQEVRENSLITSLLSADVDLYDADGYYDPGADGVKDSMSFAVAFTAVAAEFTLPASSP